MSFTITLTWRRVMLPLALLLGLALTMMTSGAAPRVHATTGNPPWKDYKSYLAYMDTHFKAPFGREDPSLKLMDAQKKNGATANGSPNFHSGNIMQVNQDHDGWPKDELGVGIDPTNPKNITVMSNDFRQNWNHMFFHTSNNGGESWFDDSLSTQTEPFSDSQGNLIFGSSNGPYNFQSDPGVVYDSHGNWYASDVTGMVIFSIQDPNFDLYVNNDSEIDVYPGTGHGAAGPIAPVTVEFSPCNFSLTSVFFFNCPGQEDKPLIWTDTSPKSPHNGRVYVTWTFFDNNNFDSVIKVSFSDDQGVTWSTPTVVSTSAPGFPNFSPQTQFSDLTVDSKGVAHIFWDDFNGCPDNPSDFNCVQIATSTSADGINWSTPTHVADVEFPIFGLRQHFFRIEGDIAPSCGTNLSNDHIYCSFGQMNAQQTGTDVMMVSSTDDGATWNTPARVNNDNSTTNDHFFPWTAVDSGNGRVWVGWYDTRNDPTSVKVQYFVGASTDGVNFTNQKPVSGLFDPGQNGPIIAYDFFFGDYDQIVVGTDHIVHAVWSDTTPGTQQIFTAKVFP